MRGCNPITKEQVGLILSALSVGRMGLRNRALFVFGCNTGFRISEILSVKRADLIDSNGQLCDAVTVSRNNMKGKNASRNICLNKTAREHLRLWLSEQAARGYMSGKQYVFCRNGGKQMDRVTAWRILKRAFRVAGMPAKGYATHSMRKTFAKEVYSHFEGKKDALRITSKAMGHKRIDSTDAYLSFMFDDITEVVKNMEIG